MGHAVHKNCYFKQNLIVAWYLVNSLFSLFVICMVMPRFTSISPHNSFGKDFDYLTVYLFTSKTHDVLHDIISLQCFTHRLHNIQFDL